MQPSINKKTEEQLNTSNNANETHGNNSNLFERKQVDGTPFTIIKQTTDNDKEIYFLVMGDHRLTEPTETEQQTLEKIITEHWKILTNVIAIITEKMLDQHLQNFRNQQHKNPVTEAINKYKENHPEVIIVNV